jgi:class 3 adenylate cyclase/tetratricopeptide (TPR) repeat protein
MTRLRTDAHTGSLGHYVPAVQLRMLAALEATTARIDGTVVFADISGFTRLTERLARGGEEGSEQLVDILDRTFSVLLAEAYATGGSMLKFGGDALLLWFEGERHAARAAAAASAMRAALRRVGQVKAGLATIVLRMSVGVHSGPYDFFLVGDSHRELFISGPAISTAVAMEAAASSGQILLSRRTAEQLPGRCLGADLGFGTLLSRAPAPGPTPFCGVRHGVEPELIGGCFSELLRRHVIGQSVAPEHRRATVAFLRFSGFDALLQEHGAQEAGRRLHELVARTQAAAGRYDVCFLASDAAQDGGKILLTAGAPRAHGDDEERMLLALREILDGDTPLPVSVGVSRGHVFAAELGPAYRRVYAAMGDIVNVAARLMAKAPDGHVYGTPEVLGRVRTNFRLTPLEPLVLKGKREPLTAWDIGPVSTATPLRAAGARRPPLIGRGAEVALLGEALRAAADGSGALIEIVGETGTGKSRLLSETRAMAHGMRLVHTTCEAYTRETPYAGAGNALRQLLGLRTDAEDGAVLEHLRREVARRQPALEPWLPLLAIAFGVSAPLTAEIEQLSAEVRVRKLQSTVFAFFAPELNRPTLIQIEHAHFIDAASSGLLNALARELDATRWLVVVTRQEQPGAFVCDELHPRLELGPLAREQTREIALATPEAERIPPHVLEMCVDRAAGSPEFLLDLLAAAAEGERDALPASISAAATARLDALESRDREVVRRLSVLGMAFQPARASEALAGELPPPDPAQWKRLAPILASDPTGELRFKRPAVQEAAYASLPFKLRRRLHAEVARSLERDPAEADPGVLSQHWLLAGEPQRAYGYAMQAARRAREHFSHADAVGLYRRAIESGRAAGQASEPAGRRLLARAYEDLGDSLRAVGEPDAAAGAFTEARRLLPDDAVAQARLCHAHAEVSQRGGSLSAAVRWVGRGLRALEGLTGEDAMVQRARLHAYLGGMRARQGRWADAERACRSAIAESEGIGERRAFAFACYVLDWVLVESGRAADAVFSASALEIYRRLGDREHESTVLNNLGMFAHLDGRWEEAVALYREAAQCSEQAGRPGDAAYTDCNVGEILSDQGRYAPARRHLTHARRVWSATADRHGIAVADALLGRLALRDGRAEEALSTLEHAVEEMRALGMNEIRFAEAFLAEAHAIAGDARRALALAEAGLPDAARHTSLLLRVAGIADARLGRPAAARSALNASLVEARSQRADYEIAATIDVMDQLGAASAELRDERDAILRHLDIVALVPVAGPAPVQASSRVV